LGKKKGLTRGRKKFSKGWVTIQQKRHSQQSSPGRDGVEKKIVFTIEGGGSNAKASTKRRRAKNGPR